MGEGDEKSKGEFGENQGGFEGESGENRGDMREYLGRIGGI